MTRETAEALTMNVTSNLMIGGLKG